MRKVNLLLGNSDRRLNNIIEVGVHDVCYNQAVVDCVRTSRIDEFLRHGCREGFDLIIVAPENLTADPSRRCAPVSLREVLGGLEIIRSKRSTPILAVAVQPEDELRLLEAGAENAFGLLFDPEPLKSEVRRILQLAVVGEEIPAPRWSLAGALLSGWQRLTAKSAS